MDNLLNRKFNSKVFNQTVFCSRSFRVGRAYCPLAALALAWGFTVEDKHTELKVKEIPFRKEVDSLAKHLKVEQFTMTELCRLTGSFNAESDDQFQTFSSSVLHLQDFGRQDLALKLCQDLIGKLK